jgi:hypothetical protein
MTEFIAQDDGRFVVLRSAETAEDDPDYRELARFETRADAERFLAEYECEESGI